MNLFLDEDVVDGMIYSYRLEAVYRSGESEFFGPVAASLAAAGAVSTRNGLRQNYPNPFRPEDGPTGIGFETALPGRVTLSIFDVTGRKVCSLLDETMSGGDHWVSWDGRNDGSETVSSGVYFYRLETGDFTATRTLLRMR
jgi:hypothetical protein